jgi:hypothetical protein
MARRIATSVAVTLGRRTLNQISQNRRAKKCLEPACPAGVKVAPALAEGVDQAQYMKRAGGILASADSSGPRLISPA